MSLSAKSYSNRETASFDENQCATKRHGLQTIKPPIADYQETRKARENILLQASWLWGVHLKSRLLSGHKYSFEISNGRHQADT